MKLKYFFSAIIAVLGLTSVISCSEDFEPTFQDGLTVSQSYVALIDKSDSITTSTITVNAKAEWSIEMDEATAKWLTISPMNGSAGSTEVKFSAKKYEGREATVKIVSGDKTQIINVIQGKASVKTATCAEVNALSSPEGKTYQVKGTVTRIANTTYGNWYLDDGTGEVYIYGTLDKNGAEKNFSSLGIEVGDEVTVQGPKSIYGTTVELVNVTVLKIEKSLIKVDSVDPENGSLPAEGGSFTVNLSCKGEGISVEVPEDAQSWLSIKAIKGNTIVFNAAENNAGPRGTTIKFSTTDGKKEYSCQTSLSQGGKSGTIDLPMTVEEAIAAAQAGLANPVYVKGIVCELVKGGFDANYGNGSFWISADGTYAGDKTKEFEAYQVNWLNGAKWTTANPQIEIGAEVVIYGPLTVYNGTSETQGKGAAHIHSINGVTTDDNGVGTLSAPFNALGGIAAAKAGIQNKVYVEGIVCELVKGGFDANYGNGSFWISVDGTYGKDLSKEFEAYQVNYLGGIKWTADMPQIAKGDKVVIYGPLTTYNGTSETQGKGAAYVYSLNGKTE